MIFGLQFLAATVITCSCVVIIGAYVCVCVCDYLYHAMGREGDRKWVLNFVNVHRMNATKQRVYDYTLVLVVVGVAIMS